jgi:murein DD-endopeptidase MepM/ murein hydrolase activator NlpD
MSFPYLLATVPATVENIPVGTPNSFTYSYPLTQAPFLPARGLPQNFLFRTELIYPLADVAPVTSRFGWRIHPIDGDRKFHSGLDLSAPTGTSVLASAAARVQSAGRQGGYGLAVVLVHWDGATETLYGHLSETLVQAGQMVQPGQVIGKVGSTGRSTGPHLHFEVRRWRDGDWVAVDPEPFLR